MQDATIQDNNDGEQLLALLQQGEGNAQRVSQHACLLDRRLRGGGTVADLRLLVQDIKFASEELHTLLQAAEQVVVSARTSAGGTGRCRCSRHNGERVTKRIQKEQKGAAMTWFDVLLKHWSDLSGEMQKKVQEYHELHAVAGQFGRRFLPERVWLLEQELQAEARKYGWR